MNNSILRNLPKIDDLLSEDKIKCFLDTLPREKVIDVVRNTIDNFRNDILEGRLDVVDKEDILSAVCSNLILSKRKSLRPVINATGVVLHTNLGRANLCESAKDAVLSVISNYSTLEYDPALGKRGSRHDHIEKIVRRITGAEAAMVVNNNAASTMIVLAALARNKEVIVSRGELVEIGGSFRIPEIMEESQAILMEVGATNKTKISDYERKINENTGALMKVHTSNYRIIGFTEDVSLKELKKLSLENDIPLIYDMGSGLMMDLHEYGIDEPNVKDALHDGADIVLFSGDKLLGGPQAGIIIGKKKYIDMMKAHPLARAFRVDKMTISALEATFNEYYNMDNAINSIPVLNMLTLNYDELDLRANLLKSKIDALNLGYDTKIITVDGLVGGGSAPGTVLKNVAVSVSHKDMTPDKFERVLRKGELPIVTRIFEDRVLFDTRTIFMDEYDIIIDRLKELI